MNTLKFPRSSKLKSKVRIAQLQGRAEFPAGENCEKPQSLKSPLLRCTYSFERGAVGEKFMVSVPKRLIRRAVNRNYLKRRIRESYRLHRGAILDHGELHIIFTYRQSTLATSAEILHSMQSILRRIFQNIEGGR